MPKTGGGVKINHKITSCTMQGLLSNRVACGYKDYVVGAACRVPRCGLWVIPRVESGVLVTSILGCWAQQVSSCTVQMQKQRTY